MEIGKIKNKGQAKLFDNPVLELLTKTHPVITYSMYLPLIGLLLYSALHNHLSLKIVFTAFIAGLLFWTFFEYMMHRHLFHMLVKGRLANRIIYTMHGVHHEFPRDKDRLFMPPVPSAILAAIIYGLFALLLGRFAVAFFPGFVFGYLLYGSMHYAIHAYAPPKYLKALWRNHHLHHYKQPDKGFGVSSVLWDIVFGTVPRKEQ